MTLDISKNQWRSTGGMSGFQKLDQIYKQKSTRNISFSKKATRWTSSCYIIDRTKWYLFGTVNNYNFKVLKKCMNSKFGCIWSRLWHARARHVILYHSDQWTNLNVKQPHYHASTVETRPNASNT